MNAPSGLDDAGRVEAITALEDLVRVATAAQAALARELDASQRAAQAGAGVPAARQGLGIGAQVALARKESHHRGQRHLGLAKVVAAEMPALWAAWRQGKVTEYAATLAARETACLEVEDRHEVDRLLAADPDALDRMSDREVAAFCRRHAARLDAASVVRRQRQAKADRRVTIRPAPDAMVYLTALLPVAEGVAAYAALVGAADRVRADGSDERGKGQVMADTLVSNVLGGHEATGGPRIELGLVMSDQTVFGSADEPAHVDGFGWVPAELGLEVLAGALAPGEEVWLRRLYASPRTGELVAMDSRARAFPRGLRRFIRLRDQVCRTPWCGAPIRHHDHAVPVAAGGPTTAGNAQGLCEACNHAKQAPGWQAQTSPDGDAETGDPKTDDLGTGDIETTTPTGHRHRRRPPVLVSIRRGAPIRLEYVLAT
ncbi:HNH endonuclease [Nocardioides sp. zg-578]|nr:HNH endonuclease [Nocardioides marmotae]MTB84587.1 HNH endonuclease [Nocardioides marmotae]